jgi:hypothetical protein
MGKIVMPGEKVWEDTGMSIDFIPISPVVTRKLNRFPWSQLRITNSH